MRRLLAALTLFAAGCASLSPQPATRFKILQINDVYKIEGLEGGQLGGMARVRSLRKLLESDGTQVLVMHGGDAMFPSVMSKYLEAKPIIDVMNLLDGDATKFDDAMFVGLGNHELDKSDDKILLARLNESQFRWVATNTEHCRSATECVPLRTVSEPVTALAVVPIGKLQVGIIGLLYPLQKPYARSSDVIAAAREATDKLLDDGADIVIAITHQDMPEDVQLVQAVPGIDLVIGGHDHLFMQQRVGDTWITKADADARSAIVYDITVQDDRHVKATPLRIVLDATMPKDPAVDARVQYWVSALAEKLGGNETLGNTKNLLEGIEPAVRGRETALGNMLTDVAREQMGTDVAILNGGSIRINDNVPPGPITKFDMEGIFYYTNTLIATRVTGQQLLEMLRNAVSRADAGDGRFLQVSGLTFAYQPRDGGFAVDAADVRVGGQPLDVHATYSLATIDYVYEHGTDDGYVIFGDATRPPKINTERELDFRTAVEQYIRKQGTITQSVEGRIIRR